jgi:uncharacterized Zn finger protein
MTMATDQLGTCPQCGHEIHEAWVLLEYETTEGEDGVWADCRECGTVVDPIHNKPE